MELNFIVPERKRRESQKIQASFYKNSGYLRLTRGAAELMKIKKGSLFNIAVDEKSKVIFLQPTDIPDHATKAGFHLNQGYGYINIKKIIHQIPIEVGKYSIKEETYENKPIFKLTKL